LTRDNIRTLCSPFSWNIMLSFLMDKR
jgi:hypothetical protein